MSIFTRSRTHPRPPTDFDARHHRRSHDITGDYTIDPAHTRLGFSARHAMVTTVRGPFNEFTGTAHIDAANPAASTVDAHHPTAQHRHRQRAARRPPALRRLLRRREQPGDHLRLHRRRARRRRLGDHRRPDHQGRHQAGHDPLRVHRLGAGPVRQHPRRLRGRDHDQPQGLGPDLERRARDRRRARLREDQARVRRLGDQERLIRPAAPLAPHGGAPENSGRPRRHLRVRWPPGAPRRADRPPPGRSPTRGRARRDRGRGGRGPRRGR